MSFVCSNHGFAYIEVDKDLKLTVVQDDNRHTAPVYNVLEEEFKGNARSVKPKMKEFLFKNVPRSDVQGVYVHEGFYGGKERTNIKVFITTKEGRRLTLQGID
jgi:hypothetical protein